MTAPAELFDLSGRRAVVTGASRGIGARAARTLDAAGATVALSARSGEQLAEVAESLTNETLILPADLVQLDAGDELAARLDHHWGGVDILINNAGIARNAPPTQLPVSDWHDVFSVNLHNGFTLTRALGAGMVERTAGLSTMAAAVLVLSGCGGNDQQPAAQNENAERTKSQQNIAEPVVTTYDGGLYVLDGTTLEVKADLKLPGFNRLNPAGDDRHVMVSTSNGFQVLDAVGGQLTDVTFPGAEPGHVVRHAGRTVLFSDGTGEVVSFDSDALGDGKPKTESYKARQPHHGVAVELENGELLVTLGNEEEGRGILVLDKDRKEIARNEQCPGVHGEATAQGEAVVIGCEDGVLVYRDGAINKIDSPTDYGRIGNQAGTDTSPIVLGDYKKDEDAELERPTQVSLVDTKQSSLRLVDLGTSYTFRSLGRGPDGEALVLGTDGAIHVINQNRGKVTRTIPVIGKWEEPLEWQEPRPAMFVRGGTAYVSDPGQRKVHAVDIASGKTTASVDLQKTPNELSGIQAHSH